jgi:hypothetical protein
MAEGAPTGVSEVRILRTAALLALVCPMGCRSTSLARALDEFDTVANWVADAEPGPGPYSDTPRVHSFLWDWIGGPAEVPIDNPSEFARETAFELVHYSRGDIA